MGESSGIEWTDSTWNPWHGCKPVSSGCKNCYMFEEKRRYGQDPKLVVRGKTTFNLPLKWKEARRIFTCSWSDFFIDQADAWRDEAWAIIRDTPQHMYQILTKRAERIADYLPSFWPLPNVLLGVSVENQAAADHRIPYLHAIHAVRRFLSCEPLLKRIDLDGRLDGIDWVIVGGESGPNARQCEVEWIRSVVLQCKRARVPVFVKQLGANVIERNHVGFLGDESDEWDIDLDRVEHNPNGSREEYQGAPVRLHLIDRKGGDMAEWPVALRVREVPA